MSKPATIEDVDLSVYSDLYKDVYGMRPRTFTFDSLESYKAEMDRLVEELAEVEEEEAARQERAVTEWEAHIAEIMQMHNVPEATAIRWSMQAEGLDPSEMYDIEQYIYNNGLPWSSQAQLTEKLRG